MVSHLPDSWPIAVGVAYASKLRGRLRATLAFCGDGATSTGLWHESLNFASVFGTPNIFVIENNRYAYSTPTERQYRVQQLAVRANAYAMPSEVVDGNDVIAIYRATAKAAARARSGEGPSLIEAMTMRMDGHAVHDAADYVPGDLLDEWRARDPIARLSATLIEAGVPAADVDTIWEAARTEVDAAVAEAESAAAPDPSTVQTGVYAG
jgi:TPP-dependent pyruvate/acetoin dehydrogenase alpha subunit